MDLLEYGMQNEKSSSMVKRVMAQAALSAVKKKADLYELYLEKNVPVPDNPGDAEAMLQKIKERIAAESES